MTRRGCARRNCSSGKPSLATAPGFRFCTNTSALAMIAASSALSSSCVRSSTSDSLPRLSHTKYADWPSPPGRRPPPAPRVVPRPPSSAPSLAAAPPPPRGGGGGGGGGALWHRELVVVAREIALRPLDLDHPRAGVGEPAGAHGRRHRLLERHHQQA